MENNKEFCNWHNNDDDEYFDTECEYYFSFREGDFDDYEFKYCPYCGKLIETHID